MNLIEDSRRLAEKFEHGVVFLKREPKPTLAVCFGLVLVTLAQWSPFQKWLTGLKPETWSGNVPLAAPYVIAGMCFVWACWQLWKKPLPPEPAERDRPLAIKGLAPFNVGDAALFLRLGREKEIKQLREKVRDDQQALLVVMGESGAGKTSLLRAGLEAGLKEEGVQCIYWEAVPTDPLGGLAKAVGMADINHPNALFSALSQQTICVILDQFEQVNAEKHSELFAFLKLVNSAKPPHSLKVVVGFRREYMGYWLDALEDYSTPVSLKMFKERQAKAVMATLSKAADFEMDEALITKIFQAGAKNGRIAPVEISIAMLVLSELAEGKHGQHLTLKDYQFAGGSQGLLTEYVQRQLNLIPKEDQQEMLKTLLRLTEKEGGKRVAEGKTISELGLGIKLNENRLSLHLSRFARRDVRILERLEKEGELRYRLPHERMVSVVRRLSGLILAEADQILLRFNAAFAAWQEHKHKRYLLTGHELRKVKRYLDTITLGEERKKKEEFIYKSRNQDSIKFTYIYVYILIICLLIVSIYKTHTSTVMKSSNPASPLVFKKLSQLFPKKTDIREFSVFVDPVCLEFDIDLLESVDSLLEVLTIKSSILPKFGALKENNIRKLNLDIRSSDARYLNGLENFNNLKQLHLNLGNSKIENLNGLTSLRALTNLHLDISHTSIENLSEIGQLKDLEYLELNLMGSKVIHFSELNKLTKLKKFDLYIEASKINSFSEGQQFHFIDNIKIHSIVNNNCGCEFLNSFSNVFSLELVLELPTTSCLSYISNLKNLTSLSIINGLHLIKDFSFLRNCENLEKLFLEDTVFSSYEGIPSGLESLDVTFSPFFP